MTKTYRGSCHCKAIAFSCELDLAARTNRCNCSFCMKARFWFAIAKADDVRVERGADQLVDYQWTPPKMTAPFLHLFFCRTCGVRPFTRGGHLPQVGGEFYAVNIGALDLTPEELSAIPISYADGRNDEFTAPPAITDYL